MTRLKRFEIVLSDSRLFYVAGDVIGGCVKLQIEGGIFKFKSMWIKLKGVAKVEWSESHRETYRDSHGHSRTRTKTVYYKNRIDYLDVVSVLIPENSEGKIKIEDGEYQYPFSFQLPMQKMPQSFEHQNGSIKYKLKVEIDRKWNRVNRDKELPFRFWSGENIDQAIYRLSVAREISSSMKQSFNRMIGSGKRITGVVSTDRTGYAIGESVLLSWDLVNNSNQPVTPILSLKRLLVLRARGGKTKVFTEKICVAQGEPIMAGNTGHVRNFPFKIPELTTSILNCAAISVTYHIRVKIKIPMALNVSVDLEIVITRSRDLESANVAAPPTIGFIPYDQAYGNTFSDEKFSQRPPIDTWGGYPSSPLSRPAIETYGAYSAPPVVQPSAPPPIWQPSAPTFVITGSVDDLPHSGLVERPEYSTDAPPTYLEAIEDKRRCSTSN